MNLVVASSGDSQADLELLELAFQQAIDFSIRDHEGFSLQEIVNIKGDKKIAALFHKIHQD